MIFGEGHPFAIEIGDQETYPGSPGIYVQFRFWINGTPIGDWDDRIPLVASVEYASEICDTESRRQYATFAPSTPDEVFQATYDAFFSYDYTKEPIVDPNLRDTFHLDGIGMGAVQDKYGLVLVNSSDGRERLIAKDLKQDCFIADVAVPLGSVETVLKEFVEWGRKALLAGGG